MSNTCSIYIIEQLKGNCDQFFVAYGPGNTIRTRILKYHIAQVMIDQVQRCKVINIYMCKPL